MGIIAAIMYTYRSLAPITTDRCLCVCACACVCVCVCVCVCACVCVCVYVCVHSSAAILVVCLQQPQVFYHDLGLEVASNGI